MPCYPLGSTFDHGSALQNNKKEVQAMPTGTVKFFNDEKGYGFISRSDGEPDIFVHFSNIEGTGRRTLVAGQEVEFELGQGRKGTEANNVRAI
jgi:CspA family cold shock protein